MKKFLVEFYYTVDDPDVTASQIREELSKKLEDKGEVDGFKIELGEVWDL